jgi:hypothetical protein
MRLAPRGECSGRATPALMLRALGALVPVARLTS